jgi:uncharacterized surface protein with fasciclin (FAS1) repeats
MAQWDHEPVSYGFGPEGPWYRRRGPLTVAITTGIAVIFLLVALFLWLGGRSSSGDTADASATTTIAGSDQIIAADTTTTTIPTSSVPVTTNDPNATSSTVNPAGSTTTIAVGELTTWDLLQTRADLSRVAELLVIAELDDVLRGEDDFTFFAPTNDAFAEFEATADGRALVANQGRLTTLLLRHLAFPRKLTTDEIFREGFVLVSTGEYLTADPAVRTLDGVRFLVVDDVTGNGVLHVMDRVLAP